MNDKQSWTYFEKPPFTLENEYIEINIFPSATGPSSTDCFIEIVESIHSMLNKSETLSMCIASTQPDKKVHQAYGVYVTKKARVDTYDFGKLHIFIEPIKRVL